MVTHLTTNRSAQCLSCLSGREGLFSLRCGRYGTGLAQRQRAQVAEQDWMLLCPTDCRFNWNKWSAAKWIEVS